MMRLTLRTLLAYLDDVLPPAETKLMGQKIQESPMAQVLVSRIREVMRRRRLKAPEVFGPEIGIDPNVVSQYLDNTLPIEQYADVERVLLASDELLAETASCHQVLTLILGDSKEVPIASRERLYALGPVDSTGKLSLGSDTSLTMKSKTPESIIVKMEKSGPIKSREPEPKPIAATSPHPTKVPEYLKPTPLSQRLIPAAVVIFLLAVCIGLAIPLLNEGLEQARTEMNQKTGKQAAGANDDSSTDVASRGPSDETKESATDRVASNTDGNDMPTRGGTESDLGFPETQAKTSTNVPGDLVKPSVGDTPEDAPVSAVDVAVKQPKSKTADAAADAVPPSPKPDSELSVQPEVLTDLRISYLSTDGILIKLDDKQHHWFLVPKSSDLDPADRIANLEPFDSQLEFDKSGVRATLVNDCVVELLPPSAAGLQGLGIARGRILLKAFSNNNTSRTPFVVAIGEDVWKLELLTDDTTCAIEVFVREPAGFEKVNVVRWYQASIATINGSARLTSKSGRAVELGELIAIELAPEKGEVEKPEPEAISSAPDWTVAAKRKAQPLRNYQTTFEKAFGPNLTVEDSMLTLVSTTKNPKIAELGAKCLAATDDYTAMVQTLAECEHQEGQAAARDGLRQWLPMNQENRNRLKVALLNHYSDEDADAMYRMLWGFSREEVQSSKSVSLRFTTWMKSSRREVRKLADYWVERLTGRPNEFNAYGTPQQRELQIRRIEEQIERNGGLKSIEKIPGSKKAF